MATADSVKQEISLRGLLHEKHADSQNCSACLAETAGDASKREWFLQAFDDSPVAVSISTLGEGRFIEVNCCFLEMTGYERGEVIGKTAKELGFWHRPDDRRELIKLLNQNSRPLRQAEFPIRTKADEPCLTGISVNLIDLDGVPCLLIVYRELADDKENDPLLHLDWAVGRVRDQLENCVGELNQIFETISRPLSDVPVRTINASLGMIVPTLVTTLRELQSIREMLNPTEKPADLLHLVLGLQRSEMYEAILDAVSVIEKTKSKFKSKDLAELRVRLRKILQENR